MSFDIVVFIVLTLVGSEALRTLRMVSPRVHALVDRHSSARAATLKDARVGILCDILDRLDVAAAQKVQFRREWIGNTGHIDRVSANNIVVCALLGFL